MKSLNRLLATLSCAAVGTVGALSALGAQAAEIGSLQNLSATEFATFTKDLTAVIGNKSAEPATPLGVTGFDIGVGASSTQLQNSAVWGKASGSDTHNLIMTKVVASKGLPWGIDVAGFTAKAASSNINVMGLNAKFSLLEGSAITPAVALRASYTKLGGVAQLDANTMAAEALISKGFLGFTPYAGVGAVRGSTQAKGTASALGNLTENASKVFVGASWTVLLANMAIEYDRTGGTSTVAGKIGVRW
jgi:hypothetical protein